MLANLFLEGTLGNIYPKYQRTEEGLRNLCQDFGSSNGFDIEVSPECPGIFYIGGELGIALAFSQGCAFSIVESITVCVIGDGEFETSITQASWQGFKFLSRKRDGKVLPIINANGNKMSSMSLLSLKSRQEQIDFFQSHGLFPIFVGTDHIKFAEGLNKAYRLLDRETPVIIFESPKGWTAPEFFGDIPFANTYKCHKPLLKNPATNTNQAALIEHWLRSYQPEDLFDDKGAPYESSLACLPENNFLIGNGYLWTNREKPKEFFVPTISNIDDAKTSMEALEQLLFNIVKHDANFLVFSPDELISNRFGKILEFSSLKFGESYEGINTLSPN
ncbi:MAG: hypothetical protein F6K24_34595, partial [Okeania sp. SIO2D1]|nr:hypothetical protein [Okeania sp. SIO2D1]